MIIFMFGNLSVAGYVIQQLKKEKPKKRLDAFTKTVNLIIFFRHHDSCYRIGYLWSD